MKNRTEKAKVNIPERLRRQRNKAQNSVKLLDEPLRERGFDTKLKSTNDISKRRAQVRNFKTNKPSTGRRGRGRSGCSRRNHEKCEPETDNASKFRRDSVRVSPVVRSICACEREG